MQVILIQTTLFGISGVLSSILNAHQHFTLPALAPVMLDLGYMIGIVLLVPQMGIVGLAWGTVIGALLHIAIQTPALHRYQYRYRPKLALHMSGVDEIIRLMGPRIVTLGTIQFADLFIIRLASALPVGSTSGYFYAYALMQFPETLFGTAIALVVFPTMSEQFNAGDLDGLINTASRSLRIIWFLTFPAAAGLVLLGRPIISFLLQGGEFTADSTQLVYGVLVVFSVRVVSEATVEIGARLFYAQHNTKAPMLVYLGWLIIEVGLAFLLVDDMGIIGLALASTIAFTFLATVLLILNHRVLGHLLNKELAGSALRAGAATAGMSLFILGVSSFVTSPLLLLTIGGLGGVIAYLAISVLLGGDEIPNLIMIIRSKQSI
jgi:putative peptidoglycan lipid II flippase